ncbi:helix-turn-helix domain-containing protein [Salmonella enterica]|nr:helix-turn-helix domain-containing protein [Salmonella enterica]
MEKQTFGQRVLSRRKELKLTQREAAQRAEVSHVTISQWERDETRPMGERLFALSKALQCSPEWLLSGTEKMTPSAPVIGETTHLTPTQIELLELFERLPEPDQNAYLESIRAKVINNKTRLSELLEAERRSERLAKKLNRSE